MSVKEYFKPISREEAVSLKNSTGVDSYYIAGGTELNSCDFKKNIVTLISIEKLELSKIEEKNDEYVIGAGVTIQDLIENPISPESLKIAAKHITNKNIRNIGTIGGNIASNKSCSNLLPVLCCLDATLIIRDNTGERIISLFEYISSEKIDLILSIHILKSKLKKSCNLAKFSRTSNDISIITTAVVFDNRNDNISDSRIFIGGAAKHVIRLKALEEFLNGKPLPEKNAIEDIIKQNINPIADIRGTSEFKKHIAAVLTADCLCNGGSVK